MSITDQIATFDKTDRRQQLLSDAELAVFAAAFARTGFTPGINWYRNFTRNWDHAPAGPDRVDAPALMIMAELDLALPPAAADGMEKYVPNLQKVLIPGCGHWTQQEKPEDTNRIIADWMRRVFPPR
jgi:pimeloyl-ACP methyl ester carboxylesterase